MRDAIVAPQRDWLGLLERLPREAVELGELGAKTDAAQLEFELNAVLVSASTTFVLQGDPSVFDRAGAAVRARLHV